LNATNQTPGSQESGVSFIMHAGVWVPKHPDLGSKPGLSNFFHISKACSSWNGLSSNLKMVEN